MKTNSSIIATIFGLTLAFSAGATTFTTANGLSSIAANGTSNVPVKCVLNVLNDGTNLTLTLTGSNSLSYTFSIPASVLPLKNGLNIPAPAHERLTGLDIGQAVRYDNGYLWISNTTWSTVAGISTEEHTNEIGITANADLTQVTEAEGDRANNPLIGADRPQDSLDCKF